MSEPLSLKILPDKDTALLKVNVSLDMFDKTRFTEECHSLLDKEQKNIVLDLTKTKRLFSIYLGAIADLHLQCEKAGKSLALHVNEDLAHIFKQTSFNEFLTIKIV